VPRKLSDNIAILASAERNVSIGVYPDAGRQTVRVTNDQRRSAPDEVLHFQPDAYCSRGSGHGGRSPAFEP